MMKPKINGINHRAMLPRHKVGGPGNVTEVGCPEALFGTKPAPAGRLRRYKFDQPITLQEGDTMLGAWHADGTIRYTITRAAGTVETVIARLVKE